MMELGAAIGIGATATRTEVLGPVNVASPVLSGTPETGAVLSVTDGTWTGNGTLSFAYQWMRDGQPIAAEVAATYVVSVADEGTTLACLVSATDNDGTAAAYSNTLAIPVNDTVAPVLSNADFDLLPDPAELSWDADEAGTAYWLVDDTSTHVAGEVIAGGGLMSGSTAGVAGPNLLQIDIAGIAAGDHYIHLCQEDASGNISAVLSLVDTYPGPPAVAPSNTVLPALSGTPTVGELLSVTDGSWSGDLPITYAYQWQRDGVDIAGATANTYTLVAADEAADVSCEVTATNAGGSATVTSSALTISAAPQAPANTALPTLSGTPTVGEQLSVTDGTWSGDLPITYAYQWQRDGVDIAGATANTYTLVAADAATDVACQVTATNATGSAAATSAALTVSAAAQAPANTVLPALSGTPTEGEVLSTTDGTWSGDLPISFAYQWLRDGTPIAAATAATYTLVSADVGTDVSCEVTATNIAGSAAATSGVLTVSAAPQAPANTVLPVLSGTPTVGQVLSTTDGTWSGDLPITYAYQWQRDGVDIAGATASTYTLVAADAATDVSCEVTATNATGSATASSAALSVSGGASFSPVWMDFNSAYLLSTGLTGQPLSLTKAMLAFTHRFDQTGDDGTRTYFSMSSFFSLKKGSTDKWDVNINGTRHIGNTVMSDAATYLTLIGVDADTFGVNIVMIDLATGAVLYTDSDASTGWVEALNADANCTIGSGLVGSDIERCMLWLGQSADVTQAAVQQLFHDGSGNLTDPATAVASIGTPIVNISGTALATGVNAGSGGDFTPTGAGAITAA